MIEHAVSTKVAKRFDEDNNLHGSKLASGLLEVIMKLSGSLV